MSSIRSSSLSESNFAGDYLFQVQGTNQAVTIQGGTCGGVRSLTIGSIVIVPSSGTISVQVDISFTTVVAAAFMISIFRDLCFSLLQAAYGGQEQGPVFLTPLCSYSVSAAPAGAPSTTPAPIAVVEPKQTSLAYFQTYRAHRPCCGVTGRPQVSCTACGADEYQVSACTATQVLVTYAFMHMNQFALILHIPSDNRAVLDMQHC